MKLRYNLDFLLIIVAGLLLIPAAVFIDSSIIRLILGLPFLLLGPGYALVACLFPTKTRLSITERLTYSLAFSLVLVMLDGLLLNFVWTIDVYPLLISLESLTLALLLMAWVRRRGLAEDEKMIFVRSESNQTRSKFEQFLTLLLALTILAAVGVAIYTGIHNIQPYSEFYILGANGKAADYPQQLGVGETGQFTLVLSSHERQDTDYTIVISQPGGSALIDGVAQNQIAVTLSSGQKQSYAVTFSFAAPGEAQKLEFDLYKTDAAEPYLSLYLKVDVASQPTP